MTGVPTRRPADQVADAHEWANKIREANPRFGGPTCGDPTDLHQSPFRRATGLAPIHRCVLRLLARAQLQAPAVA